MDFKRIGLTAAALYVGAMAYVVALSIVSVPVVAQDRVPSDAISDRIRQRMDLRRTDRAPPMGSASKVPGGGPGYESVLIKGQARTFMRYTPNSVLIAAKKAPVVFALHGAKGTADRLQGYLGLNAVAEREGFIVVYPQGLQNVWNDGRKERVRGAKETKSEADDVGFLIGLADALVAQGVADPERIYLTGLSNGGFMSMRLACEPKSPFAAYAAVIASLPQTAKESCKPGHPVPLIMINGTEDKMIRYDGGEGRFGITGNLPPDEAAGFIAGLNGCATAATDADVPPRDATDATRVMKRVWSGCKRGGAVELYTIKGGGHQSPTTGKTSASVVLDMFLGTRSHQLDTAETVWDFFKRAK